MAKAPTTSFHDPNCDPKMYIIIKNPKISPHLLVNTCYHFFPAFCQLNFHLKYTHTDRDLLLKKREGKASWCTMGLSNFYNVKIYQKSKLIPAISSKHNWNLKGFFNLKDFWPILKDIVSFLLHLSDTE